MTAGATTPIDHGSDTQHVADLMWTGGWDSSFRLMQRLLIERRPVRPTYVINLDRRSLPQELRTMAWMRRQLLERIDDPEMLAPTRMVVAQDFARRQDLEAVAESIRTRVWIGHQYAMFAGIADKLGWQYFEPCMAAQEDQRITDLHRFLFASEHGGELKQSPDVLALFRYWSFPVLHLPKTEMGRIARQHGFYDVLVRRWFCHQPVLGKACGRCHPCHRANREGVEFANPAAVAAARAGRRAASLAPGVCGPEGPPALRD